MPDQAVLLEKVQHHWKYQGSDVDRAHEIYHDDAVLEFPQSGERFEGVANFLEWRRQYPAKVQYRVQRMTVRDDIAVVEVVANYNNGPWQFGVQLLEFRGEKVARERIYIAEGWDAAGVARRVAFGHPGRPATALITVVRPAPTRRALRDEAVWAEGVGHDAPAGRTFVTYRVIQWATGNQGVESIRAILDRDDLELVGVWVYSEEKEGSDAGTLVGRDPVGVTGTRDIDALLQLDADCVAYMPRIASLDDVCAILASGANLTTTAFLFYPPALPPDDLARLRDACEQGQSSIHGTGLNPGNLSGVLPLALSGMSRSIERITLQERADWSFYESTHITFDNMRFGRPAEEVSEEASEFLRFNSGIFKEEIQLLADALGADIDEITTDVELVTAEQDHDIFGHTLAAGTVAGQRWHWSGRRDGRDLVDIETLWTVGGEYPNHWPRPADGWTLTIEGEPSMRAHFLSLASYERDLPMTEHVRAASIATAMQAVNAIPALCDAPPGIRTMADLPLIRSGYGFGFAPPRAS